MDKSHSLRKNPSRETCEKIIRKILSAELMQQGTNIHFKQASDFMNYFESLYPASDSLTKQVQRAVKTMNLPKDSHGYYIINKTQEQLDQDEVIKKVLSGAECSAVSMDSITPVFLSVKSPLRSYVMHLLGNSATFKDLIVTISETSNGLLLYTNNAHLLCKLLEDFYS